jgi:hypothetical protein
MRHKQRATFASTTRVGLIQALGGCCCKSSAARCFGYHIATCRSAPVTSSHTLALRLRLARASATRSSAGFSGAFAGLPDFGNGLRLWFLASSLSGFGGISNIASGTVSAGGSVVGLVSGKFVQVPGQHRLTSHSSRTRQVASA